MNTTGHFITVIPAKLVLVKTGSGNPEVRFCCNVFNKIYSHIKKWGYEMATKLLAESIDDIYKWIESQIIPAGLDCSACGKCCNFESYGHRIFITTAELFYLSDKIGKENIKKTASGVCPYNIEGNCSIYQHRFSACRIFFCRGEQTFQNNLSELAIKKIKSVCDRLSLPYRYVDLSDGLGNFNEYLREAGLNNY